MLPSLASKNLYIVLRLRMLGEGHNELQILTEFMQVERKLQKAMERMHTSEENATKQEPGQQSQCTNCGKSGHKAAACRSARRANKSHGTQQKNGKQSSSSDSQPTKPPCPACNLQYKLDGDTSQFYWTRLSACPTFRNLSIQDKTTVAENAKACVLCLNWKGNHT